MPSKLTIPPAPGLWDQYVMAMDKVTRRLERITDALGRAQVPYALIGGQAVALWVATRDPAAVRTTKDVDILLDRADLPKARAAATAVDMDYFETVGVGMFLERDDPNPRPAVHLVWAGEKVRPENEVVAPEIAERVELEPGKQVIGLAALVRMKLVAHRDQDRVHLRDLIEVGLVDRGVLPGLPGELAGRLEPLLTEAGK